MTKDAYYFSHDANARNDQKLMMVRIKYGMKGHGIYFGILEMLRETSGYQLPCNFIAIAYDLREQASEIEDIIINYDLFKFNQDRSIFYSESLKRRLEHYNEVCASRSVSGRKGAEKRWGMAIAIESDSKTIALKESKGKEITTLFDEFYSKYPKKKGKEQAFKAFVKLAPNDELFRIILSAVDAQSKTDQWKKDGGQFIPMPSTWINGKRWEDEIKKTTQWAKV